MKHVDSASKLASKSVIVGVDGSSAAIDAAKWAVDEVISRDVPLRLIYVSPLGPLGAKSGGDFLLTPEYAESALGFAERQLYGLAKPVKIETAILRGKPEDVLIEESRDAALICVGSIGMGRTPETRVGPVAAALAGHAHCSVAIVRPGRGRQTTAPGWIGAVLNDEPDNDAVIQRAMKEARLRKASVLLVDRREDSWLRRYPDVHIQIAGARSAAARRFETPCERLDLVVVSRAEADCVTRLVTPNCHPILGNENCSVLVVRD
jgi:nucleotide-binding universal stress UspA family protein